MPTSTPNSVAIGYRKSPIKTESGPTENAQNTNVGRKILFEEALDFEPTSEPIIET
ncbi:MAG TPA: hypothetical protein VJ249_05685 [Candidatus Bathyarchaeia archaeon]|nr:hypothetical protein [Candidatus Bathyarchaeia archaeon]